MNSFIENVNYVAGLDNLYGSSIEIYKNNLSLRTELHDIVFTLEYYNFFDKKLHTLEYSYNDISIDNFNSTLLNLKSQVELTGLFDCVVSFSYTNFIINNVASVDIKITSKSENIKTHGLNLNITKDLIELYSINGIVSDTLKILPYLASIDSDAFNDISIVADNIEYIQNIEDNVNIAIAQANISTVKASEALSSANSASASEIVSITNASEALSSAGFASTQAVIATTKASEASTSASNALSSANTATTKASEASVSATNASNSAISANSSASAASISETNASNSEDVAIAKANEALTSANNASASEANALVSKNSASISAGTAIAQAATTVDKANESTTSANNALASENKAEKWANELEDIEVEAGKYSAKHWALKAEEFSSYTALNIEYDNNISGLVATNVQSAIDELVAEIETEVGTAGTYRSVTTDAQGRVTAGTNPTTLSGYCITDADTSAQVTTKVNNAVSTAISGLVNSAPGLLDTLDELANALGADPSFATTVANNIATKVTKNADIVAGTGTKVTYDTKGLVTGSSTPTTLAGYSIGDAYTKTELNNGQLDSRYYTETEVNNALALKVDDSEIASVNLLRADKYLAAQNVVNIVYNAIDKPIKVQYNNATDVDYEVLSYNGANKLINVAHYASSILKGNTVLTYSSGKLISAPFTAV